MDRFIMGAEGGRRVLLLHGLTGSPAELWPLATGLAAVGWRVELPVWPGHATRPDQLARTLPQELVSAARVLGREGHDAIVGFSMGALLALVAAAERTAPGALVLLAPALRMTSSALWFDRLGRLPWLPASVLVGKGGPEPERAGRLDDPRTEAGRVALSHGQPFVPRRYDVVPLVWARHLRMIRAEARRCAARLEGSAIALHGTGDRTADVASLDGLGALAPKVYWDLRRVDEAPHQLCVGPWRGLVADVVATHLESSYGALHSGRG
jgi:alpha-beta hydrolase superfamily lysophospholipase